MAQAVERGDWTPNWATHPGEHLADYLDTHNWSQAEFARRAGLTPKLVSTIISGQNRVSPDTAVRLQRVLGLDAQVWLGLQSNWDLFQTRRAEQVRAAENKAWADRFPLKELRQRGILPDGRDLAEAFECLLSFLGIGSSEAFEGRQAALAVRHRQAKGGGSSPEHVFAWLTLGERKARKIDLPPFDAGRFRSAVDEIRTLTVEPPGVFEPRMKELCRSSGVALVFEPAMSKTRLFGSARWLDGDHAVIQMSLRMKSNDHFWWTFFHEAAHLLLHRGQNFLDDEKGVGDGPEEEADLWTANMLIGNEQFQLFANRQPRSEAEVRAFARDISLHPGIVVGMLQHAKVLPYSHLNGLKARFDWSDEAGKAG